MNTFTHIIECSDFPIVYLSEDLLFNILKHCSVRDFGAISQTCKLFYRMFQDDWIWKHLCKRDFYLNDDDLSEITSFSALYKNLLHKYGWFQGLYQIQNGPYGGILEVKFNSGSIEGVNWETSYALPGQDPAMLKIVLFSIIGYQKPPDIICLPELAPHSCVISVDKRKGEILQKCSSCNVHAGTCTYDKLDIDQPLKMIFLNEAIGRGLLHQPIIIPQLHDIPEELQLNDGTYPPQLITPGLYKGTHHQHGSELFMVRYKDENEIHVRKVTGDPNVFAGKISVKILLKYPVDISIQNQSSVQVLKAIEPRLCSAPLLSIKEQPFIVPQNVSTARVIPPDRCKARFHGFGQIAYEQFTQPSFIPVHVMVFNHDLFGVLFLDIGFFSLFRPVKQNFTKNILSNIESVV